ncbi:MAG: dehydrogenase [Verrucomicrobiota bacterium]|nr:dehydrogenase [Verrucomicrobiota bacterium]
MKMVRACFSRHLYQWFPLRASFLFLTALALNHEGSLAADRDGIQPLGKEGKPLNLGFETGDLKDWTASGMAFDQQPIKGDTVASRRGDMQSNHDGEFWLGTFEIHGDNAMGTMTSVPFKVTHPFASFLVAGGRHANTRVELVLAENKQPFMEVTGDESENLRPVVVDLKPHQGKEIFIRIVDAQEGHWGHINFDDFRFHAVRPQFPNEFNGRKPSAAPAADTVKFAGLSAEDAAREATGPDGFKLQVFAAEPDVKQPIAFALDDRGRMWVAEAYTYPHRAEEGQGKDRILIFEDSNGDGKFDQRKVFAENLNLVSGMEVGFGGVWVGAAPYLMFIPDRNGDDQPDGPPQIMLDGWAWQDTHETLNTFTWGPDGWLYGCHGVFTHSNVGKPGAKDSERTRINAGIWRYHPLKHRFELFSEGTSNPWGIDFDEYGQCHIEACVIPHFFHMIQGGRYQRQAGQHFNPHIYEDILTIADHVHYAGDKGPHAGNNRSDSAGGGHAHAGLMIYLGGSWPAEYRGKVFMNNIHGQRLNMDILERKGSGYVARHGPDFINFQDKWSQVLNFTYDQDGSVYLIDWYDQNQCHHGNAAGHDRSNGRIFKLVYNNQKTSKVDLAAKSDADLVAFQLHENEWYVRHARRLLMERGPKKETHAALQRLIEEQQLPTKKLRALWALHATGGLNEATALQLLKNSHEYVRAWTIQLLCEDHNPSAKALEQFEQLAKTDPSPVVRLYLAAAMQRTAPEKRWGILTALLAHGEDAADHNLPLMYWYAAEPPVAADHVKGIKLLESAKIPKVREWIARRITSESKTFAITE